MSKKSQAQKQRERAHRKNKAKGRKAHADTFNSWLNRMRSTETKRSISQTETFATMYGSSGYGSEGPFANATGPNVSSAIIASMAVESVDKIQHKGTVSGRFSNEHSNEEVEKGSE